MRVLVFRNIPAAASTVAEHVVAQVRRRPGCVLGLAAGRTMIPVYEAVVRRLRREAVSLRQARAFALDEVLGVAPDDARSMIGFIERHFLRHTDLPVQRWETPDACSAQPEAECARYEERIRAAGGIDLQLLGIGRNGHIGFNEPGCSLAGRTAIEALACSTRKDGGGPARALTMGVGTILESRECLLVAFGTSKAEAIAEAVEGPVASRCPASALQLHPAASVVLDEEAAGRLEHRDRCC